MQRSHSLTGNPFCYSYRDDFWHPSCSSKAEHIGLQFHWEKSNEGPQNKREKRAKTIIVDQKHSCVCLQRKMTTRKIPQRNLLDGSYLDAKRRHQIAWETPRSTIWNNVSPSSIFWKSWCHKLQWQQQRRNSDDLSSEAYLSMQYLRVPGATI